MMTREEIRLDWTKLLQLRTRQFPTGKHYDLKIKRESLPLVFVPGIMGSRLRAGDDLVWDPNNKYGSRHGLARRYGFQHPPIEKSGLSHLRTVQLWSTPAAPPTKQISSRLWFLNSGVRTASTGSLILRPTERHMAATWNGGLLPFHNYRSKGGARSLGRSTATS